jgi:hypothetical protein
VNDWLATAKHPVTGKAYTDMVYQPMLELLDYRCHSPGRSIKTRFPESMDKCLRKLESMPAHDVADLYGNKENFSSLNFVLLTSPAYSPLRPGKDIHLSFSMTRCFDHHTGFPSVEMSTNLKLRARQLLVKGFEWTLFESAPLGSTKACMQRYMDHKPCCDFEIRGNKVQCSDLHYSGEPQHLASNEEPCPVGRHQGGSSSRRIRR